MKTSGQKSAGGELSSKGRGSRRSTKSVKLRAKTRLQGSGSWKKPLKLVGLLGMRLYAERGNEFCDYIPVNRREIADLKESVGYSAASRECAEEVAGVFLEYQIHEIVGTQS